MKAWVCKAYGGIENLVLEDRPLPAPKAGEILVRIRATTVSSGDMRLRTLRLPRGFGLFGRLIFGLTRPRQPILGSELSGVVAAVGADVRTYRPGDAVIAFPGAAVGCHAEYRVLRADQPIAPKPGRLTFEEAASLCFGGTTALHFLRKAKLAAGEKILVIGASGAVGSALVQLARHCGAVVTGVTSTRNLSLVQSLGAEAVIDYTTEDFLTSAGTYDVIADSVGASSFARCHRALNEHGRYLGIAADLPGMFARPVGTKQSIAGPAAERAEDVAELASMAAAGVFQPIIDKVYPFTDLPAAHAHVETGHKRGSVVVTVPDTP